MLIEVFRFELRYRLRQPVFYLLLLAFFFLAFGAITTDSVQIGGSIGKVARNAPAVLVVWLGALSAIGLLVVTAFVSSAVNRDHELQVQEIFFSTPVSKTAYLGGRFAGSVALTFLVMIASALGFWLGSVMPFQEAQYIVPFQWSPYLFGLGAMALPNLFLAGAIFFTVATLTRRVLLTYVSVVAFFALWGMAQSFMGDLENEYTFALCDPFGLAAVELVTRYWTVAERNAQAIPFSGILLWNRLLWVGMGFLFLGFTLWRFRMQTATGKRGRRQEAPSWDAGAAEAAHAPTAAPSPLVKPVFSGRAAFRQWRHQALLETRGILMGIPFLVFLLFGLANLIGSLIANPEGTVSYPVTRLMLQSIEASYSLIVMLLILVYAATLVFKERTVRMHEMYGALPMSGWIPLLSKFTAVAIMIVTALLFAMAGCIAFQAANGYFRFEIGLYAKELFLVSLSWWLLVAVLAFFFQVATNNRYVGFFLMIQIGRASCRERV